MSKDINLIINEMMRFPEILAYIGDVKVNGKHSEKEDILPAYKRFPEVVFDSDTYNFHVFPCDVEKCECISNEFRLLRNAIIKYINDEIIPIKKLGPGEKYEEDSEEKQIVIYKRKDDFCGHGQGNTFPRLTHALRRHAHDENDEKLGAVARLYRFVEIFYKGPYTINFMRYTCDENGMVGCTMRAIQFHKAHISGSKNKGYINMGVNNDFAICYTKTDKDRRDTDVDESDYYADNSAGNVCFNPPVEWPKYNKETGEYDATDIGKIIDWFICFVENKGAKKAMDKKWNEEQSKNKSQQ